MKTAFITQIQRFSAVILIIGIGSQSLAITPQALSQGIPSLAPMLEEVTPAVVSIRVSKFMPTENRFFPQGENIPEEVRRYFENLPEISRQGSRTPRATGAGSGVIFDADQGLIISNHHVVAGANSISVQLADGRTENAELLGSDAETDIALLRIDADELSDIQLADIDSVQVGDYVVAIGNPFGIGQTVTSGIVSALGRAGLNRENYEDFIQTDAAINLGNSGGALVDLEGNLIGINTAILSGNGGSNGIGFAVPVDMVAAVVGHLQRDGEVRRGMLGVSIIDLNGEMAGALNIDADSGALVTSIVAGSAAEKAGIEISDVIVEIAGEEIQGSRELRNKIGMMLQDQKAELVLYRNGEIREMDVVIGGRTMEADVEDIRRPASNEFRGARVQSTDEDTEGVLVSDVVSPSTAWSVGLREGDVIVEVNREKVDDLAAFNSALNELNRFAAITVIREGRRMLMFFPPE
ncbi:MAG: Do family serine endopeptidase [Gammaproteobacteria bacterium]|mgnify:FL=1|nr:Do family serine endopeptidase [Gammaproteobacteria bacterium]MBT3859626.1 Do family serine endopeptidase [Gammaproteobacteria bacterium]MBT3986480.1 Do family serine endopeptidase [Gammaproteobacteria bacterium]MBT4256783.1 Do family serine endopeptidase [Gammaproteobacteria bacterium]MBT4582167.1 Do family serine endopeptidase [Gammaproteobacteria bacterium]